MDKIDELKQIKKPNQYGISGKTMKALNTIRPDLVIHDELETTDPLNFDQVYKYYQEIGIDYAVGNELNVLHIHDMTKDLNELHSKGISNVRAEGGRLSVTITLPGIKAVSRNQTTGHFFHYYDQLQIAEQWMYTYGKKCEYHFTNPVEVSIEAHYKTTAIKRHRNGKSGFSTIRIPDVPNIDDKIFTDVLVRWKQQKKGPAIERRVWFIEDDNPNILRSVTKKAVASNEYKVIITIIETL